MPASRFGGNADHLYLDQFNCLLAVDFVQRCVVKKTRASLPLNLHKATNVRAVTRLISIYRYMVPL